MLYGSIAFAALLLVTGCEPNVEYITVERQADVEDSDAADDGARDARRGLWRRFDRTWDDGAGNQTPIATATVWVPLQSDADCSILPPIGEALVIDVAIPAGDDGPRTGTWHECNPESSALGFYQERCFHAYRMTGPTGADISDAGDTLVVTAWHDDGDLAATLHATSFPATTFTAERCAE